MAIRTSRSIALFVSAALALAAVAWWTGAGNSALAQGPADNPPSNPVFASKVSGTWLGLPGQANQLLMNIYRDGTLMWFGTWFYGGGLGNSLDGPVYGNWKQTGPNQLTTHELGFLFDGDGEFWATGRVVQVVTFSPDFQTFTVNGWEGLYYPNQDPTDPNEVPFTSFNFTYGPAHRLNHAP
jgi:hypothetical protein